MTDHLLPNAHRDQFIDSWDGGYLKAKNLCRRASATLAIAAMIALCACGGPSVLTLFPQDPDAPPAPSAAVNDPDVNDEGAAGTFTTTGALDRMSTFFRPFGNGRSCSSCHDQAEGWSITPELLSRRFESSGGTDPIFLPVDGANSPLAAVSTLDEKRIAYSLLLSRGGIRIGLPIPVGAEFTLDAVDDPYDFASAAELSLFRRPIATTNLRFSTSVMWDSRETALDPSSGQCVTIGSSSSCFAALSASQAHQANEAVRGHAQAALDLTNMEKDDIVTFENSLFTAQLSSKVAGSLIEDGARGGPLALSKTTFYFGINDVVNGDSVTKAAFEPQAMMMFGAWAPGKYMPSSSVTAQTRAARESIARGESLFNTRAFNITAVQGFNDAVGAQAVPGTCTSCHSTPNVGGQSVPRLMNTGISDGSRRTPDMPLYTLRNTATGQTLQTTDPGQAMNTGKWVDIGKMRVPSLRGLESRSPYFHNGFTGDLNVLLDFYNKRFNIQLTPKEIDDLSAFLRVL